MGFAKCYLIARKSGFLYEEGEAAYGIPDWIKDKAYSYLDEPLKDVLRRWRDNKCIF